MVCFYFNFSFLSILVFYQYSIRCGGGLVTNCVRLFAIPWIIAHQAPLSMGFPRQEYWSGLHFLLGDLLLGLLHSRWTPYQPSHQQKPWYSFLSILENYLIRCTTVLILGKCTNLKYEITKNCLLLQTTSLLICMSIANCTKLKPCNFQYVRTVMLK